MNTDYSGLLIRFLEILKERKIPFTIVGGIALLQHVKGRNTEDIDLILAAPHLEEVPELTIKERSDMFAFCKFGELRVDVLFASHPLFQLVADDFSQPLSYQPGLLPTATIDGLILLKLFALPSLYRQYDFDRVAIYESDITQLLARSIRDDQFFLGILADHIASTDRTQLAEILTDIRSRLARVSIHNSRSNR